MSKLTENMLSQMGPAKALAIGSYGEDMAAYRYLQLSEKASRPADREEFRQMVTEEQEHRDRLQALMKRHFPGAQFVLTPDEKQMVESGWGSFQITDRADYHQALRGVTESELLTAKFYDQMERNVSQSEIRAIFRELADEGFEHHQKLRKIALENGVTFPS